MLGIVMTGMGSDGREGAAWIKAKGGTVLTESEASCVVYGMPRSIVEAGLSDGEVMLDRHGRRDHGASMSGRRSCWSTIPGMARRSVRGRSSKSAGYVVVEAEDGLIALERYFLEKPDLVLLDLVMKGMNGLDVLKKLTRAGSRRPG